MSETARMWVEVLFNVSYLLVVWGLTLWMTARLNTVPVQDRPLAKRFIWAFGLLALGDTGHVGFRVVAYALGGLEANPVLVGLGALSTAYTVTLFYMLMVDIWRLRYKKPLGVVGWALLGSGVVRLIVMAFPQNQWNLLIAPYDWSLLRNAFLTIQGVGVMILLLRDAAAANDTPFRGIGGMIALSFLFYAPVILWAAQIPMLGMLMIPKTMAYLGVAVISFRALFRARPESAARSAVPISGRAD